jgi:predicted lipid-binding transport protein (Tim44 family)
MPAPGGGGFFRSFGGGLAGGLLGGMLLGSLMGGGAHAGGMGGLGGSGIGIVEILLIGGLGYLAYRMLFAKRTEQPTGYSGPHAVEYEAPAAPAGDWQQRYGGGGAPQESDLAGGIAAIRASDPSFDEQRFCDDTASVLFFKIQGAFAGREMAPVANLLTTQVQAEFQDEADSLRARKQFNRLENIAVRKVEIVEAWQEAGQDYATVLFRANLLDYLVDESGTLVSGSKSDPVLFEEYWTFVRPSSSGGWKLSAISQP